MSYYPESSRDWYVRNRERMRESRVRHRRANKDKQREYSHKHYEANKQEVYSRGRVWAKSNQEKLRPRAHRRRAIERGCVGTFSAEKWLELLRKFDNRCAYCSTKGMMTVDHRIPLIRGGTNFISNIVPACVSCNCRKRDAIWEVRFAPVP